jgi:hypothetical protein
MSRVTPAMGSPPSPSLVLNPCDHPQETTMPGPLSNAQTVTKLPAQDLERAHAFYRASSGSSRSRSASGTALRLRADRVPSLQLGGGAVGDIDPDGVRGRGLSQAGTVSRRVRIRTICPWVSRPSRSATTREVPRGVGPARSPARDRPAVRSRTSAGISGCRLRRCASACARPRRATRGSSGLSHPAPERAIAFA